MFLRLHFFVVVHNGLIAGAFAPRAMRTRAAPGGAAARRRDTFADLTALVRELVEQTQVILVSEMIVLLETLLNELLQSSLLFFCGVVQHTVLKSSPVRGGIVNGSADRVDTVVIY